MSGIGVSPGVVIGPAYVMVDVGLHVPERTVSESDVSGEVVRFEESLIRTREQIKEIQRNLASRATGSEAGVLDAHLMVVDDRALIQDVVQEISTGRKNAEWAAKCVSDRHAAALAALEDDYLRERVADIRDVGRRIIRNLSGGGLALGGRLRHKHIVISRDLAPSETASLRHDLVVGFAIDYGSPTSHTAVMARALEIPAIVGLRNISEQVKTGDEVLIDGNKGVLIIRPTLRQLQEYGRLAKARKSIEQDLVNLRDEPAETADGHRIILSANIEGSEEVDAVLEFGAEGIGLFRSEYLYLSKHRLVDEEEQAQVYEEVAARLAPAPVIIRTLDIGGDKYFPDAENAHEPNPFLGCRSIRLSFVYPEHFKAQLRALLRASRHGNVKIMYPMISNVHEVIRANELLEEAKADLDREGVPFDHDIEVGAMIEIPSAALTADIIAEHVKFFSIGTNDLVQYTLAVDRVNERVAYLYEPTHPAVLRLIQQTVEAAHRHGIWVGLCGEMAADPLLTPLLLGLGMDELSVAPSAVPLVKDAVRSIKQKDAAKMAEMALGCKSADEVLRYGRRMLKEVAPEILELI